MSRNRQNSGKPNSWFPVDPNGVYVRIAPLDGAVRMYIPAALRPTILHRSHYSTLADHSGEQHMYATMRTQIHWPHVANDAYATVDDCTSCARNRHIAKTQRKLRLFSATEPLEFVAIDILGPLPKTANGNQYIIVMTDRFSKLTKALPTAKTTATTVATTSLEHWVANFGILSKVVTDNGPQFTSKFFAALCTQLGIKAMTTTEYHPQANGQVERFNRTIASRQQHYVAEHRCDWDAFVLPLTYVYNSQVHRATKLPPCSLFLTRRAPGPATVLYFLSPQMANKNTALSQRLRLIHKTTFLRQAASDSLRKAQQQHKAKYDNQVRFEPFFAPGDHVFVERPLLTASPAERLASEGYSKLLRKRLSPYRIIRTGPEYVKILQDGIENVVSINVRQWNLTLITLTNLMRCPRVGTR